ncbi:hypothetical protein P691DRAFT_762246 [Macrolepiota fuliginosa MF-IS2]|uniref:N-acetyltransferase domain-containing protein n=1 Tax=Macrolepiota fuliginosa MF-IS2 TaxID=1400762 RepID=A0A9P6BZ13_9AGAR|nr:hypothetical protein P691DRAFT_762246 [Macrolepiota fuliginosa MF-IS2]
MVGGRHELRQLTFRACIRAGIVGGKFYVALTETDEVVGTAVWYPPGYDFLSDEKQQQEGAIELMSTLEKIDPDLYAWWINTLLPLNAETSNKYLGKDFKVNNWNLYSLAVAPRFQGKGISRLLVKIGEDQAAAQGLSTCFEAESEKNLIIYERLGYRVVGSDHVPGPPNAEGYNCHCLVKYFDPPSRETQN